MVCKRIACLVSLIACYDVTRGHTGQVTRVTGSLAGHLDQMIKGPSVLISTWWFSMTVTTTTRRRRPSGRDGPGQGGSDRGEDRDGKVQQQGHATEGLQPAAAKQTTLAFGA